jgi:DNA topoisomerase VI subunit B
MNKLAEKLVAEKKYDDALAKYPNTPAANMVRNAMAEQLYYSRKFDELVAKYPNTQAGMKARTEMAKVEFDKIMKMAKKARQAKLEEFLKNPNFARTESAMKAQEQLNRLTRKP